MAPRVELSLPFPVTPDYRKPTGGHRPTCVVFRFTFQQTAKGVLPLQIGILANVGTTRNQSRSFIASLLRRQYSLDFTFKTDGVWNTLDQDEQQQRAHKTLITGNILFRASLFAPSLFLHTQGVLQQGFVNRDISTPNV